MKIRTQSGIQTVSFISAIETVMAGMMNGQVLIRPQFSSAKALGDTFAVSDIDDDDFLGVNGVLIGKGTLSAQDVIDLFTTPIAGVEALTVTKVGARFNASSSSYTPNNLAANISGDANRTTLRGVGELLSALLAGDGTGLTGISGIAIDQASKKVSLIDGSPTWVDGTSTATVESIVDEISPLTQGWFEAA